MGKEFKDLSSIRSGIYNTQEQIFNINENKIL